MDVFTGKSENPIPEFLIPPDYIRGKRKEPSMEKDFVVLRWDFGDPNNVRVESYEENGFARIFDSEEEAKNWAKTEMYPGGESRFPRFLVVELTEGEEP